MPNGVEPVESGRVVDAARLRMLAATGLLDSAVVPSLDRLTSLAAQLVGAPLALVSLVDADRQVFASECGLRGRVAVERQTPLSHSYCKYVVADDAPLVVSDARTDERLHANPAIVDGQAIAYAGCPVRSPDGQVLGSFCVVDTRPRQWTEHELAIVQGLAQAAESEIAVRLAHREIVLSAARMQAVLDTAQDAFVSMTADGVVTAWNAAAERLFGWSAGEAVGRAVTELMVPPRLRAAHDAGLARVRRAGVSTLAGQRLELAAVDRDGREFPIELTLQVNIEDDEFVFHAFLHDITKRKAAQAQLESERQHLADERTFLQALLDSLDAGVVACDDAGRLTLFNQAVRRLHGVDHGPLVDEAWAQTYKLYAPDGQHILAAEQVPLARAFAGETVQGQHLIIEAASGQPRRFVVNGRPIDTPDGRRLGAVVAMHDITDAHNAETLRRAQHAVAEALSQATNAEQAATTAAAAVAGELGWVCAEYWQVTEDRRQIARVSSWTAPGRNVSAFTGPQPLTFERGQGLPGQVWQHACVVWSTDPGQDITAFTRRPAAEQAGLRTVIGLPVDSADRVVGVLAFFTDTEVPRDPDVLTMLNSVCAHVSRFMERRRAEDLALALAAARHDLDQVIARVNDFVWRLQLLPDGTMRVLYSSPNSNDVYGGPFPTDANPAETMRRQVHPEDRLILEDFFAALAANEHTEMECRVAGADGVTRWLWIRAFPRCEGDHLVVDGISTNITERRQLAEQREQLVASQQQQVYRLQELDRMKDDLVAVVSHELRNPIGVIRSYTEMLLDEPALTDHQRADLSVIDRTTSHLEHIIDDLLDLAHLDAGGAKLNRRPLSLVRLIRDSIRAHQPAAATKHLTLTTDIDRLNPVPTDAARLRQVLDNLLSNAIKYTPNGGTVTITAGNTTTGITITVADTGIGIPADQYPHLFTRFFRASTATERGIKGTGLGLAVTKAIIDAHHGTITAHPAAHGGTRFTITLPNG
ncbi:PAS domain S-box protein [Actinoplanes xinjiangensis]|uniref:PAS domain S-box protein n=1 Tax=Actinoplanes xinjiangensis TaxID=512350 RepID=UPI003434042E